ncbi:kinase-like protein [Rhizophagus irregularis]|uniref:Kinase-like protein n=1 Tax=Rhizophagus irregularis TaxID=588596 RepID=A0A2I1GJR9_9GLOM|nr:kinase-like protein [Rhizophagus irregularis]
MSTISKVQAALNRSKALIDYNICNNIHKRYEFRKQTLLVDSSLTGDEKTEAIKIISENYDREKISRNKGTKRICENCNQECFATLYCEYCIRNYLKTKFSNWTSGNDDIDNLIQQCQMETLRPNVVIEWIPYNKLQNIKYLTKGGFSEIYTAKWIDGRYEVWNSKEQKLKRSDHNVNIVLKRLENVESANNNWFEEAKSHLTISNKDAYFVQCYGLTQDPLNKDYMLVMGKLNIDLRKYLQQNHNQLTWKVRIFIAHRMIEAIYNIHRKNIIHRDLHSGNILHSRRTDKWYISDLGFCGPADKPTTSIYGNLPYIAPEVISGKQTTKASDIYSVAMLMWEISSGQPPFVNYEHDYNLAMNIINGIRPKLLPGTPLEYKNLIVQCWDADPLKRPKTNALLKKMDEIHLSYQSMANESFQPNITNNFESGFTNTCNKLFASKIHQFENFPEPRNATEEEQEEFHSKPHDFHIPDNIDDFDKSNTNQKSSSTSTISNNFEGDNKDLLTKFNELQINSEIDTQNNFIKDETMQQQIKTYHSIDISDEDEICNNPNFHSEEQDEFEIPNAPYESFQSDTIKEQVIQMHVADYLLSF